MAVNTMTLSDFDEALAAIDRLRGLVAGMQARERCLEPPDGATEPRDGNLSPEVADLLRTIKQTMVDPGARENGVTVLFALLRNTKDSGQSSTVSCSSEADIERVLVSDDELVSFATAFANPARLRIMRTLAGAARSSAELSEATGLVGGQLYHHLRELIHIGFVRQEARNSYTLTVSTGMSAYLGLNLLAKTVGNRHGGGWVGDGLPEQEHQD